ncbi:MAG: hypothetical protein WC852_06275 [Candidatus Nanoarchaeia archaeon]|jgi:hypothetical protein
MTNTKAWIGLGIGGVACYFAPEAIEYVTNLLGSSTHLTPNSESDWHMLRHIGEYVMAGGAIGAVSSLVGKVTENPARKICVEGGAASGMVALGAHTDLGKNLLYAIDAYTPSMQSKIEFGAEVALAAFCVAFVCSCLKKEEPKKK